MASQSVGTDVAHRGAIVAAAPVGKLIPIGLPIDMPKAWFVALSALSKSATPKRVKQNATSDHAVIAPSVRTPRR